MGQLIRVLPLLSAVQELPTGKGGGAPPIFKPKDAFSQTFTLADKFTVSLDLLCNQGVDSKTVPFRESFLSLNPPHDFLNAHKPYSLLLQIDVFAPSEVKFRAWDGWVHSRVRQLVMKASLSLVLKPPTWLLKVLQPVSAVRTQRAC